MKLFACQSCGARLYFENTRCETCGSSLGYLPDLGVLSALRGSDGDWRPMAAPYQRMQRCANAPHDACNWLVPADGPGALCEACALNRTIPNLDDAAQAARWTRLEVAKRRLIHGLRRLELPLVGKAEDPDRGVAFDFLAAVGGQKVLIGHADGVITINVAEADDVERERVRAAMAESYRTPLGHMRHEIGHYYWDRLVRDGGGLEGFRALFGDERDDYAGALARHYENGPPADWNERHVSGYASAHPWEDFAETWAHYLHIVDTLETADAFRLSLDPAAECRVAPDMRIDIDPYHAESFDALFALWLPLTFAVNSLNRSMGQPDLYPFVVAPAVVEKLRYVHGLIGAWRGRPFAPLQAEAADA